MVVARFQSTDRCVGYLRDLLVRHIIKVSHIKNQPLFIRQFQQCFLKFDLNLIARHVIGVVQFTSKFAGDVSDGKEESSLLSLKKTETLISRDPVDPRVELSIFAETFDMLVDFYEDFLGKVIGVIMVNYH